MGVLVILCVQHNGTSAFWTVGNDYDIELGWEEGDEPFQDNNCNNILDEKEKLANNADDCESGSMFVEQNLDGYTGFCDKGNGIWDDVEWDINSTDIVFFKGIFNNEFQKAWCSFY